MTEDDNALKALLRSACRPVTDDAPPHDLWPAVVERLEAPVVWSWFDVILVAALSGALLLFPESAFYFEVPSQFVVGLPGRPLERAIVFPMAVVPNVWGLWNMWHLALRSRVRLPLGLHGALLPLVLMPLGFVLARPFDIFGIQWQFALPMAPIGMAAYYLAWKYLVAFLNAEVGIA
ncbi:MAG: hypothetical protein HYY76_09350 [Acidobacteria bacterium]|nr:hypothetical protein [Acidobacteriota bacterium]